MGRKKEEEKQRCIDFSSSIFFEKKTIFFSGKVWSVKKYSFLNVICFTLAVSLPGALLLLFKRLMDQVQLLMRGRTHAKLVSQCFVLDSWGENLTNAKLKMGSNFSSFSRLGSDLLCVAVLGTRIAQDAKSAYEVYACMQTEVKRKENGNCKESKYKRSVEMQNFFFIFKVCVLNNCMDCSLLFFSRVFVEKVRPQVQPFK